MLPVVVLACYLASAAWLASSVYRADGTAARGRRAAGVGLGALAVVLHATLLWMSIFSRPEFALSMAEAASLFAWATGFIAVAATLIWPRVAGISAAIAVVAAFIAPITTESARFFERKHHSWELTAHIILSTAAYALLAVAAALAVALALLDRRLHRRKPLGWLSMLPPLETLEGGMFQALSAGFAVLTLALFSGFFFVDDLFAQDLSRKTIFACLAWVVFGILLFGRWRFGWRGRTALRWTLSGFVLLVLAYFGSKFVLEFILGRHWG